MGIINITPDSFSDGGLYNEPHLALERAKDMLNEGAAILDLGAQSTRPGAEEIGIDEELQRLIPCLKLIRSNLPEAIISIDTFHSEVAEKAMEYGANWINDVSGSRRDKNILKIASSFNCPYVITHSRGNSKTMNSLNSYSNVVNEVKDYLLRLTEEAIKFGISKDNIIWDPGLGFSKDTKHNIDLLCNLEFFTSEQFRILIGPSRKRFIGDIIEEESVNDRLSGTLAVICRCQQAKVDIVRVHDVKMAYQAIRMISSIGKVSNQSS